MKALPIYRFLTYVLLPIGALLSIVALFALLLALSNITVLLSVFILGSVVIYIFSSFHFLNKGITQLKPCKHSLKDWIKVNGYVSILFAGMCIFNFITIQAHPEAMNDAMTQAMSMQGPNYPQGNQAMMLKAMHAMFYAILVLSIVLIVHITMTFRFLKTYAQLFQQEKQ
ncbi:hypothetical protein ACI6Q2_23205 [Chitinophagaceae bacterium LWZ2-11]